MEEMKFPNNIAMIRRMRGLTQAYVAEQIGVSRPKYIDIERGMKELTVTQVDKILNIFDVSFEDLLGVETGKLDYRKYISKRSTNNAKEIIPPKLFENQPIRSAWDGIKEEWYFSVIDIVMTLTGQLDYNTARKYWNKLKQRLIKEGFQLVTNCHQLKLTSPKDGKKYVTDVVTTEQAFRIIQSIPSKKAEPFKQWLASVGAERINQMVDPEQSIHQALEDYRRLGYSDDWINLRLKSIEIRKDLTNTWDKHGVKPGQEYASLTDIIYQAWAGKTAKEYKQYKGLHKENLRDNMTNEEMVLNMLAELSTTSITEARNPKDFKENADCAKAGGDVAKVAREKLESETGKKVVSKLNAKTINQRLLQ